MSNHKKIDWFRWHQRKYFIRINCAIMCAILLIILLLMFPIVSDAESPKVSDYFYCDEFLSPSGYLEANYPIKWMSDGEHPYSGSASSYYDSVKKIFDAEFTDTINNNYHNFFIYVNEGNYYFCLSNSDGIYLPYSNYNNNNPSEWQKIFLRNNNGGVIRYRLDGNSLVEKSNLNSYTNFPCDYILCGNVSIKPNGNSTQLNYLLGSDKVGWGSGGLGVTAPIDNSIIDNDYIGENSFMYGDGVSINQWNLIIGLDLNDAQMSQINKYHYVLDCTLQANYTLAKGITRNQETSLLQSYGLTWASNNRNVVTMDFSKTYTDTLTTNYFTIPSTVFNDGLLCNGYTAVPLVNYISTYVPKGSTTNEIQSFFIAMSNVNVGPFSLPGYNETEWFNNCNISYNFSMNVYNENDDLITSLPLAMSYNPMTGQQSNYSNGGGKSQTDVQNTINQHNQNKTPTDPDYKNPDDYKPTISKNNNDSSNNSNSNSSSSSNPISTSNASVTINQPSTYPTTPIMNKFISIIHNEKQGSVDKVESIIESNGYIELCNQALSAVPQPIWDAWTLAIKAILGILVSAFFLKILVNWST